MPSPRKLLPFLDWFRNYDKESLRSDFVAGLTVALVLVPQSMAYAQLAGLPAYYGLYAAFLPPIVASLFGSSRQLATGPVAVVSLMTAAALEPLATAGSGQYVAYAILLALMVGIFQLALGLLRLGLVVNFLSHPVVNGFTNAAALIIATSQLASIFGVSVDKAPHHYETVYRVLEAALDHTHLPTLGMAAISFTIMIGLRKLNPKIPNVLVAVAVTTTLAWSIGFERITTTPVDRIRSEHVQDLVEDFNAAVEERGRLEGARAEGKSLLDESGAPSESGCVRCHEDSPVHRFTEEDPGHVSSPARKALAIDHMAGLISHRIDELKNHAARFRTELRHVRLKQITEEDGEPRFLVTGEVEPGTAVDEGTWKIRVGNRPLDEEEIPLTSGGAVVGLIPAGLPPLKWPDIDLQTIPQLFVAAVIISILGFMEAISIAKAMAARTKQKLDPNQELIGQGLSNIVGCMGQSYAVSGSFSRSAVNLQAGARTGMSNIISGVLVAVVLLFFSAALYHLPRAVLASIIMMAVFGLLNVSGFVHAWRTQPFDGFVSVITFVATLALAPHLEWGIFLGVVLSVGGYVFRTMHPAVATLAPHTDGVLRDARRHGLRQCTRIAAIRFDGPLNFANASYLEDEVLDRISQMPELRHVLIVAHGINEVDASGEDMLRNLLERLRGAEFDVSMCGLKDEVEDVFRRSHLLDLLGEEHLYPTQAHAIAAIYAVSHTETEQDCPFRSVMPRVTELSVHSDDTLRDAERHGLRVCRCIALLRFDDTLTYANADFIEQDTRTKLEGREELRQVVFVAHGVVEIDRSAGQKLVEAVGRLRERGLAVAFSGLRENVIEIIDGVDTDGDIGPRHRFPTQLAAIAGVYSRAHSDLIEPDCPLLPLAPRLTELSLHPRGAFRDARRHRLPVCCRIAVLRFDGPVVLADPDAMEAEFIKWAANRPDVTHVVFLAHNLEEHDEDAAGRLLEFTTRLRARGLHISFVGFPEPVSDVLGRCGVADAIGVENIYLSETSAIAVLYNDAHRGRPVDSCPLRPLLPHVAEVSLHPDGSLRNAARYDLAVCRFVAVLRIDGPLNYANVKFAVDEVHARLADRAEVRHVLLACGGVTTVDEIACGELGAMVAELRSRMQGGVSVSSLADDALEVLQNTGCVEIIGADAIFPTYARAIEALHASAHAGEHEAQCPLIEVTPC